MIKTVTEQTSEDYEKMGSFNHSYVQVKLGALLVTQTNYTVCSELSLDVSQIDWSNLNMKARDEMIPDLCLYPKRGLSLPRDILRMSEPPLSAIEIISPRQGTDDILLKFQIYFEMGVKTCWLVDPTLGIIALYQSPTKHAIFSSGDLFDQTLNIHLPVAEIFA
ncbi:Uma2 family endonuclease [Anaerolineales bacterium HSG24]|nr:Uma2 family endonuclease [Anaerolineales bacterium HSG24]